MATTVMVFVSSERLAPFCAPTKIDMVDIDASVDNVYVDPGRRRFSFEGVGEFFNTRARRKPLFRRDSSNTPGGILPVSVLAFPLLRAENQTY